MSFKSQSKSSDELIASDEQLKANTAFQALHAKYSKVASDADIAATVAGLEKNNHTAIVVATKDEALQAVLKLLPKGVTINNTGSTTLVRFDEPIIGKLSCSLGLVAQHSRADCYWASFKRSECRTRSFAQTNR